MVHRVIHVLYQQYEDPDLRYTLLRCPSNLLHRSEPPHRIFPPAPKKGRILSLLPICLLTILSLTTAHKLSYPTGFNSTFAGLCIFYLPYSIKLLALDSHAISPEFSNHSWPLTDYYRAWNNPRALPVRLSLLDRSPSLSLRTRLSFAAKQLLHAAFLFFLNTLIFRPLLTHTLSHTTTPTSFSPSNELPLPISPFSLTQLRIRILLTLHWLLTSLTHLSLSHILLSILFTLPFSPNVPSEWPPLFHSPVHATSLRRFWGLFWHQITIPTYRAYAELVTRKLLHLTPGAATEKILIPGLIFLMSGLSHAVAAWAVGDAAPQRDVLFFMLNYLAVAAEVWVAKAGRWEGVRARYKGLPRWIRKAVGMVWVFGFLVAVTPLWIYPKVRAALEEVKVESKVEVEGIGKKEAFGGLLGLLEAQARFGHEGRVL
ncbi:MAG: hypothetical protein Q9160_007566 [Pyrenula sp. 1 TL-2023]